MIRSFFFTAISVSIFALGVIFFFTHLGPTTLQPSPAENQVSAVAIAQIQAPTSTLPVATTSHTLSTGSSTENKSVIVKKARNKATFATSTATTGVVERIQNPYPTAPLSADQVNAAARAAIVNILCQPHSGSLRPISGSGVIIDPKGIILTNAHVAQYVLLSESTAIDLTCTVRIGSPAQPAWTPHVIFIPSVWVSEHAAELNASHPTGTGEHDYALLAITGSVSGTPLPTQFPFAAVDTRPAIGFPGDQVLVASYPAEFAGGLAAQYGLYANSTVTTIKQLLTFASGTPDVVSLGGVIEAQSGSSGGAVVNGWGKLIALIATTSDGATTAARDLRAISLSYIDADLRAQTGESLTSLLTHDPVTAATTFGSQTAPSLIDQYIAVLSGH